MGECYAKKLASPSRVTLFFFLVFLCTNGAIRFPQLACYAQITRAIRVCSIGSNRPRIWRNMRKRDKKRPGSHWGKLSGQLRIIGGSTEGKRTTLRVQVTSITLNRRRNILTIDPIFNFAVRSITF